MSSNLWNGFEVVVVVEAVVEGIVVVLVTISLVKIGTTSVVLCITAGWNLSNSCHKLIFLSKAFVVPVFVDLVVEGSSGISNWVVFKVVVVSTIGIISGGVVVVVVVGIVVWIVVVRTVVGMAVVVVVVVGIVVLVGKVVVVVNGKIITVCSLTVWTWLVGVSVGLAVAISVIFLINNSRLLIVVVSTDLYLYLRPSSDSFDSVCIWFD